ncbi:hypothetical protein OHA72_38430 [Dactylosporangium sp. NBC_01737]|uniref:hypothetical protein n=1 Tax=Dactylosporangium sp. NBC_01737 TaxID=2975959 RepID=UPI002E10B3C4|nr:hypothetical protein OHA72_38430 [Dactylosporangium sp. NBC_01737]
MTTPRSSRHGNGRPDEPDPAAAGQRVLDLLDKAIDVQSRLVRKNIARACRRNPDATPASAHSPG